VCLAVYDLTGRRVVTLTDQMYSAGSYSTDWEGTDASGFAVSSGTYFVRMETATFVDVQKLTLIR
jgi:flagellar hook assembly protein FlgD